MSNVAHIFDRVVVELSTEEANALATVLGSIVDRTPGEGTERLYNSLIEAGVIDDHYAVEVHTNVDYDPSDEDDFQHFVVLDVR